MAMGVEVCKTCGVLMKIKPSQTRKKMCTRCAYDIKKIRSSVKYWEKKDRNSTRYRYWRGRLQAMEKMLNEK